MSYRFSTNSGGDASAHAGLAADWLRNPTLKFVFDGYPPGHFWLIGLSTLVVHDVVAAARLLSLVLGVASVVVFWKLARLLYGEWGGLLSLMVFALYTLHIGYSTTSSSEISFLFFVLLGAFYFFSALKGKAAQIRKLAFSGASLSIAESIRFEGWILFAGLFVILAVLKAQDEWRRWPRWFAPIVSFGATGGAWPVFMMAYSWREFGDPMYLVTRNRWSVLAYLANDSVSRAYHLAVMPSTLLISLSPLAIFGAMYGMTCSFRDRLTASFASLIAFFAVVECYEVYIGGLLPTARYTLPLGTMLALVGGYGLQCLLKNFPQPTKSFGRAVIIILLFLNPLIVLAGSELPSIYSEKLASVSPRLRYQKRIQEVGDYLRKHLGANDAVVIDDHNRESNKIADAAGLPIPRGNRVYLLSKLNTLPVYEYISTEHPRFLVYATTGALQHIMQLREDNDVADVNGIQFRRVFRGEIYRVYQLTYP